MRSVTCLAALTLALVGSGCQWIGGFRSKSAATPAPVIGVEWSAYAGSAVGGPTTRPVASAPNWLARITLLALKETPGQLFEPLSARGQLFAMPALGEAVLASPQLTASVRYANDAAGRDWFNAQHDPTAGKLAGVVTSSGVIRPGMTLVTAMTTGERVIELRLAGDENGTVQMALLLTGTVQPDTEGAPPAAGRESVLIGGPQMVNEPVVLIIPLRRETSAVGAIAVRVDLSLPSADDSFLEAQQQTETMLAASREALEARPSVLPVRNDAWSGYERVLQAQGDPAQRRAAMNFVAAQTGATIAHDLIVAADDATLGSLHQAVLESMPGLNRQGVLLGWLMDYAALKLCVDRASAGPLPSEMLSVLTIHLGEAGRNTASLGALIAGVTAREELQTRVVVENLIYLEDSSPASRVRAYDFLAARGKAPAEYDPLGSLKSRRAALERFQNPPAPATQPGEMP